MLFRFVLAGSFLAIVSQAALADIGPCKPDINDTMLCGSGIGAARVIPGTLSPDKTLALAWRDPKGTPDTETYGDNELLLIRVADGAVLAKATTDYFHTGTMHANRKSETALWSPDSRMVMRVWDTRFESSGVTLWAISADRKIAGEVDLLKVVAPAVRAQLKRKVRNPEAHAFLVMEEDRSLTNDGRLAFHADMQIPKGDFDYEYLVTVNAARTKTGLTARVLKVEYLKN